jgi:hypothetical protein
MSLELALADAAKNCRERRLGDPKVLCTITLRNGVQYTGELRTASVADMNTRMMDLDGGAWVQFLVDEVVAVESHR